MPKNTTGPRQPLYDLAPILAKRIDVQDNELRIKVAAQRPEETMVCEFLVAGKAQAARVLRHKMDGLASPSITPLRTTRC